LILRLAVRARRADDGVADTRLANTTSLARGDLMVGVFDVLAVSALLATVSCAIVRLARRTLLLGVDKRRRRKFQEKEEDMEEEKVDPREGRQGRILSEP